MGERLEALMRIIVGIVSGFVLGAWGIVIEIIVLLHWLYVIILGKRHKGMAEMSHDWLHELYRFYRYMVFHTNERPFPFTDRDIKGKRKFE